MLNHSLELNDTVPFYFEEISDPSLFSPRNFTLFASYVGSIFSVSNFHNNTIFYDYGFSTITVLGHTPLRQISFILTIITLTLSILYTTLGTFIIYKIKALILSSPSSSFPGPPWPPQKILGSSPICRKDQAILKIKAFEGNLKRERSKKGFFRDENFWEVNEGFDGVI